MEEIIGEIQTLINQVQGLPLNAGQKNSLTAKLEAAINQLSKAPPHKTPACGQLKAFVNEVEAYIQSNKLTKAQGQPLIDDANAIRTKLGCFQGEK